METPPEPMPSDAEPVQRGPNTAALLVLPGQQCSVSVDRAPDGTPVIGLSISNPVAIASIVLTLDGARAFADQIKGKIAEGLGLEVHRSELLVPGRGGRH